MKISLNNRKLGQILISIALIGMIFSFFGIITTWYYKPKIEETMLGVLDSLEQVLNNTRSGLIVINDTMTVATGNIEMITDSLENATNTLDNIAVSLTSSADLIGGDLRETIIDTQIALTSAAQSAGIIDNTLRLIAAIPILGADYRPEVPLSTSLANVSESLMNVPEKFLEINQFIKETEGGLGDLQTDISVFSAEIQSFEDSLTETQTLVAEYDLIFETMQEQFLGMRKQIPTFLLLVSIFITGGFFFLGFSQIIIYDQGKTLRDGERVLLSLSELNQNKTTDH
ncbi:MAG: hypothetical protein GX142_08860 [Chloroflexi bacterium]|jgi:hypothetical protein|nr:hypothetical protein [Chloroflexota bacterium]